MRRSHNGNLYLFNNILKTLIELNTNLFEYSLFIHMLNISNIIIMFEYIIFIINLFND